MTVRIEFFGIPRQRAGVEFLLVDASTIGAALQIAAKELPEFGKACLQGDRVQPTVIMNVNGEDFSTDPDRPLENGDTLLIMSADAGG